MVKIWVISEVELNLLRQVETILSFTESKIEVII